MRLRNIAVAALALLGSSPAFAQEEEKFLTVSGSVGLVSDYRFRGVSQTDKEMGVQGGITLSHASGFYAGTWGSNLAGWGTFGGSNTELDLFAGYKVALGEGMALDAGLTWYMYPGGASETDFAELYAKLSTTVGPVNLLGGVAYAPKQQALGRWYFSGASASTGIYDDAGDREDNLYLWADISSAIPDTPITLKGHIGYSEGNSGLGPNGTSVAPTGKYIDWLVGADFAVPSTPLTLGVAYVDTNISKGESAYLLPNFSSTKNGSSIASGKVVFSLTAAF